MAGVFTVDIVEPTGSIFRGDVQRFHAPGVEGSFEVLRNHAPMLAETKIGPVFITTGDGQRIVFAASKGFVQVASNRLIMLVESAEPASDIDVERAKAAERRAQELLHAPLESSTDREQAEEALERARNRVRIAMGQVGTR